MLNRFLFIGYEATVERVHYSLHDSWAYVPIILLHVHVMGQDGHLEAGKIESTVWVVAHHFLDRQKQSSFVLK